jgi:alpha-ketoglutarate-dependent taurine dioxygenase
MEMMHDYEVSQITSSVGAVIGSVDLREPMQTETIRFIRRVLLDHGVVFFRNQDASVEQLWAFLTNFGTPQKEDSFGTDADRPEDVQEADFQRTKHGTAVWHTDSSFLERPPKFTLLRAIRLPPVGGDTCWANMVAAYEALSKPMRSMLDGLTAIHSIEPPLSRLDDYGDVFLSNFRKIHALQQVHPVVLLHPETGRKALYVTQSCTTRIVELSSAESRGLLDLLFDHIKSPDFSMRWRWSPNDVAMWDNRSVQHYAVPDYDTQRVVHRIIVSGDRPHGPSMADTTA